MGCRGQEMVIGGLTPGCPGGVWAGSAGWGGVHLSGLGLSDQSSQLMPHTLPGGGLVECRGHCPGPAGGEEGGGTAEGGRMTSLHKGFWLGGSGLRGDCQAAQHLTGGSQPQPHDRLIGQLFKCTDAQARPQAVLPFVNGESMRTVQSSLTTLTAPSAENAGPGPAHRGPCPSAWCSRLLVI